MTLIILLFILEVVLLVVAVRFVLWATATHGIGVWFWSLMVVLGAMLVVLMMWDGLPVSVVAVAGVALFLLASVVGTILH